MFWSAILLVFVIIFIVRTFIVVPQQMAYIKERLGKYSGTMSSGLHFLVPLIDRVAYRHTLKEEVIDVPPQICITKDNVQVEVDGILYARVLDAFKASYGINDYRFAAIQLAQTSIRSEIGKLDLDRTFVEREKVNEAVVKALDIASEPWGTKVTRYEIKNIVPPKSVLHTMEKQMTAERDKRAEIMHSEGERAARINRSEGEKIEAINISEGEKQKRINESMGTAREIELVAEATAEALTAVADAISAPGGHDAVSLRIAEEYIRQFGGVVKAAQTSIVPLGPATVSAAFQGLGEIIQGIQTNRPVADASAQNPPRKG